MDKTVYDGDSQPSDAESKTASYEEDAEEFSKTVTSEEVKEILI